MSGNRRPGKDRAQEVEDSWVFDRPVDPPGQDRREIQQLGREVLRQWLEVSRAWSALAREAGRDPQALDPARTRRLNDLEKRINEAADEFSRLRDQLL